MLRSGNGGAVVWKAGCCYTWGNSIRESETRQGHIWSSEQSPVATVLEITGSQEAGFLPLSLLPFLYFFFWSFTVKNLPHAAKAEIRKHLSMVSNISSFLSLSALLEGKGNVYWNTIPWTIDSEASPIFIHPPTLIPSFSLGDLCFPYFYLCICLQ